MKKYVFFTIVIAFIGHNASSLATGAIVKHNAAIAAIGE